MMQKKSHEDCQKKISSLQNAVIRYTTPYLKTKIMAKKSSMDKGWELTKQIEKLSGLSSQTHCVEWKIKHKYNKLLRAYKTKSKTMTKPSLSEINKLKADYEELHRIHMILDGRISELESFAHENKIPYFN